MKCYKNRKKKKFDPLIKIGVSLQKEIDKYIYTPLSSLEDSRIFLILCDVLTYLALRSGDYSAFLERLLDELRSSSTRH